MVLQAPRFRQVLLDRRQIVEAAAVYGRRLLQRPVLEELLPVDLARGFLGLTVVVGRTPEVFLEWSRGLPMFSAAALGVIRRLPTPPFGFFLHQDRVVVEFLPNLVLKLEAGQLKQPNRLLELGGHHQLLRQA